MPEPTETPEPLIRPAHTGDLEALLAIEELLFRTDRLSRRQMRYMLTRAKAFMLVAECDGKVVGSGLLLAPALPRPARVYSLGVLPAFQGRHLGRRLLGALLTEAERRGYRRCRLEVRASLHPVIGLYQSMGFTPVDQVPGYYGDGETALRMEASLPGEAENRSP